MTYRITMKTGIAHETEAVSEPVAIINVWREYYSAWSFKDFIKKFKRIEKEE